MYNEQNFKQLLNKNYIIPVVVIDEIEDVITLSKLLIKYNVKIIEITLRTKNAFLAIKKLKEACLDILVGVGTVCSVKDFKKCEEIGVDFIVSPGTTTSLLEYASKSEMFYLPGVMTSSEILKAKSYGFDILKLFPANIAGGIKAITTYGSVYTGTYFCPTGGVNSENYKEFLKSEYTIAVGGTWIAKKDMMINKQWKIIEENLSKLNLQI